MARVAARVYTLQGDLARLEAIAQQLPQDQRVQITLHDGSRREGMISATPGLQAFFDPHGREGMNALLKLDTQDACVNTSRASTNCTLWLDEIASVERLPNPSPPQPSRAWPPDPNAPTTD